MIANYKLKQKKFDKLDDVGDFFNELLLEKNLDLNVAYDKYNKLKTISKDITKLFTILNKIHKSNKLSDLIDKLNLSYNKTFNLPDLSKFIHPLDGKTIDCSSDIEIEKEFIDGYKSLKKQYIIALPIKILSHLKMYKIKEIDTLTNEIVNSINSEFLLHSSIDYYNIYIIYNTLPDENKNLLIQTIFKLINKCKIILNNLITPDVNINILKNKLKTALDTIKKEIPRCDEAFDKLSESLYLLENNFGDYYEEYTCTESNTCLLESFIVDVSNNIKADDPKLKMQFIQIVNFLKNKMQQAPMNNKLNDIFKNIDNFLNNC